MVQCRCGCEFENTRWDSFVTCPDCGRVYANEAPNLFHPKTLEELRWMCHQCSAVNEYSAGSSKRIVCAECGAKKLEDADATGYDMTLTGLL